MFRVLDQYGNTKYKGIGSAGPTGPTGPQGATGPAGATGAAGAGVTWKGAWSNVTAYSTNDAVGYLGSSWIANAPNTNKIPGTDIQWDLWVAHGSQGTQGSLGPTGAQGTQGSQGSAGVAGASGATGATGADGARGSQGTQGTQGSLGPTGATGNDGARGSQGTQGSQSTAAGATGPTGAQGTQGTQGSLGPTGATGATGAQGTQGSQGPQGTQGSLGPTGATGPQGTQGTQGSLGPTGPTGATGVFNEYGFGYSYSTATGATAVTGGFFALNASGPSNATSLFINETNDQAVNVLTWITSWFISTNTNKATLTIRKKGNTTDYMQFHVSGTLTDNGSWDTVTVTNIGFSGTFSNNDQCYITASIDGDRGSQGTQGSIGVQGTQGTQGSLGPTGASGATGAQGTQGTQGSLGPTGATGATGAQGSQGTQGSIGATGATGATGQSTMLINTVTGPSYTFQSSDIGGCVSFTATGTITAHIPNPLGNAGDSIVVRNGAGGTITINGATGTTINAASTTLNSQWSEYVITQETATNTWWIGSAPKGATGASGATGPQGTQGSQGSIGVQGTQGSAGSNSRSPSVSTVSGVTGATPNAITDDVFDAINIASGMTFYAPSGTGNNGQLMTIRIRNSTVTSYHITWTEGTGYTAAVTGGPTLPTFTNIQAGKQTLQFVYDTNSGFNRWILLNKTAT